MVELAESAKDSVRQGDFVFAAWPFAVADPEGRLLREVTTIRLLADETWRVQSHALRTPTEAVPQGAPGAETLSLTSR